VLGKARKKLTPAPVFEEAKVEAEGAEEVAVMGAPAPTVVPEPTPAPAADASPHIDPKSAALHNQRGRELLYQGHYQQAIDELTTAIELQPNLALAYNARGFTYYLMRDTARAFPDFDQAIRLNPAYANAYHNRSIARNAAGDKAGSTADEAKSRELTAKK
jgi:tetratricopeptide (TPR) repeat protein